jgi:hypothetical protein
VKYPGIAVALFCLAAPSFLNAQEQVTPAPTPVFTPATPPPASSFVPAADPVYQWSVRVGEDPLRRAYLWIPDDCRRVRGVLIGIQNMLEQEIFADPAIRKAAAAESLAIVWITPGDDFKIPGTKYPDLLHKFNPPQEAINQVQKALDDLAKESGYSEISTAPLIATGHSAATPFVWGMDYNFDPARMAAIFPCKGWFAGAIKPGIPVFHIDSEYGEVGGKNWGETYLRDRIELERLRGAGEDRLLGEFVDVGAGHYEWDPASAPIVAMFIRKAAHYRIPAEVPANGPVTLKPIDPASGWLIDPDKLGSPEGKPAPVRQWKGDPKKAFWYFDEELANAVNDFMAAAFAKKPQVLSIISQGKPKVDYSGGGVAGLAPQLEGDGATFQLKAGFLDRSPTSRLYNGEAVGHATGPIFFKASTGAIHQTGPDTFRIWMKRGGLIQQGQPWEPHITAYQPGDGEFRRADRPIHPNIGTINKYGALQTITFQKIADQSVGATGVNLQATTDAGLPVQFYVVSGPVRIDPSDNTKLNVLSAPPRAAFPLRAIIGAYQWGRVSGVKVQNAEPVFQEFMINR